MQALHPIDDPAVSLDTADRRAPASSDETLWFLVGRVAEQSSTSHIPIQKSPFLVGRRSDAALCLPCSSVSSCHAELIDEDGVLHVQDLKSTNGTFVNGERVSGAVQLKSGDLLQFASNPFRVMQQTFSANQGTVADDAYSRAMALVHFDKLMSEEAVVPHYQPIVTLRDEAIVGYEALARSRVAGLESPAAMFSAAVKLNLQTQLSEMLRFKAIEETRSISNRPHVFLNTHPSEVAEPHLVESMAALREQSPQQQITLEIHEAAVTGAVEMRELRAKLREYDIQLAFDDFGAGQARLAELAEVQPDYLKFDISFIRDIHLRDEKKAQMVGTLVKMVSDMGVVPLAEGVECQQQRDKCAELGFELAQGYLFGRPAPLRFGASNSNLTS